MRCTVSQWWHYLLLLYTQGIWTQLSRVQQSRYNFATHLIVNTTADLVQLLRITAKKHSVNCPLQQRFASQNFAYRQQIVSSILTLENNLFWPFFRSLCPLKVDPKLITQNHINSPVPSLLPELFSYLCYRSLGMRLLHQYNTQIKQISNKNSFIKAKWHLLYKIACCCGYQKFSSNAN